MYPKDSTFRILTFQYFINDNHYKYYGSIQTRQGQYFQLSDQSAELLQLSSLMTQSLPKESWFGAIYYNILTSNLQEKNYYTLLGFNGYQFFNKIKVMEILTFDDEGQPQFGLDVFEPDTVQQYDDDLRKIYIYSADAAFHLNFDPIEQMIVFDHLIPMNDLFEGQGETAVPDGSLEGWSNKNGKWYHLDVLEQKPLDDIMV